MRLTLDPLDLKPEHRDKDRAKLNTSKVRFQHFTGQTQKAIVAAGRATYYAWDRQTYNAILPPKVSTNAN